MLDMDDYILEQFYGTDVEMHVFARDAEVLKPTEFVRKAKLARSPAGSGKLLEKFDGNNVYHVPETNSVYFNETFSDFDIIGTVEGNDGLVIYCDFYDAWNPEEVHHILVNDGWEANLS